MYVYKYVCMYVYTYIYIYRYIHTYIHVFISFIGKILTSVKEIYVTHTQTHTCLETPETHTYGSVRGGLLR
jgi:hypothetical protein